MTRKAKAKPKIKKKHSSQNPTLKTNSVNEGEAVKEAAETDKEVTPKRHENKEKPCHHVKGGLRWMRIKPSLDRKNIEKSICKRCKLSDKININKSSSVLLCLFCGELLCKDHALDHHQIEDHKVYYNMVEHVGSCLECNQKTLEVGYKYKILIDVHAFFTNVEAEESSPKEPVAKASIDIYCDQKHQKQRKSTPAAGLVNLGNTCFFNSTMQNLINTKTLCKALFQIQSENTLSSDSVPGSNDNSTSYPKTPPTRAGPLINALTQTITNVRRESESTHPKSVDPRIVFLHLQQKWKVYKGYKQQDAHELLRRLLGAIIDEQLNGIQKRFDGRQRTSIEKVFSGRIVQTIVCDTCKICSLSYEEFMDISLPLDTRAVGDTQKLKNNEANPSEEGLLAALSPYTKDTKHLATIDYIMRPLNIQCKNEHEGKYSLMKALKEFMKVDLLDGESRYECSNCFELKYKKTSIKNNCAREKYDEIMSSIVNGTDVKQKTNDYVVGEAIAPDISEDGFGDALAPVLDIHTTAISEGILIATTDETTASKKDMSNADGFVVESMAPSITFHHDKQEDEVEIIDTGHDKAELVDMSMRSLPDHDSIDRFKGNGHLKSKIKQKEHPPVLSPGRKRYLLAPSPHPEVLVLHLKRFSQSPNGRICKIENLVEFDQELDLSPFIVCEDVISNIKNVKGQNGEIDEHTNGILNQSSESRKYKLYGIVVHSGSSISSGHYYAYIRLDEELRKKQVQVEDVEWIYASDTHVRRSYWNEVRKAEAYILFYERI